jgi:uncharacterized protein (DUF1800 family)
MKTSVLRTIALGCVTLMGIEEPITAQAPSARSSSPPRPARLTEEQRALHALNRLTFGPRPGDLQKVLAVGVDDWVEQQLHPEEISNSGLDDKLAPYRTLKMQTRDLVQMFPPNNLVRLAADGKMPIPNDPARRGIYETQVSIYEDRQKQDQLAREGKAPDVETKAKLDKQNQEAAAHTADDVLALPKEKRMAAILAMPLENRRVFVTYVKDPQRGRLLADFPPDQREVFLAMGNPYAVVTGELQQAKLLRALYSNRQLEEVMTDFWFNHFNVFLYKDLDQYFITSYERDVIRAHAFGKFEELLASVAESPAMLFYLDNWLSIGPNSIAAAPPSKNPKAPANPGSSTQGLNENYGRELMELHTLSVDGGYTQQDVTEVARVFTGWTTRPIEQGAAFYFEPRKHEPGSKTVLGQTIPEGGQDEGVEVLHLLAHHPKTAWFISYKLAQRFVADDPPPQLVRRMSQKFLATDGDIREVLRTMFKSSEFWSPKAYRAKVKTPLEFVMSSLRATATDVSNPAPLLGLLGKMGMPPYQMAPPTGYKMVQSAWMNSDALLDRLNFALALSQEQVGGASFDAGRLLALGTLTSLGFPRVGSSDASGPDQGQETALLLLENGLVNGVVSPQTQRAIRRELDDPRVAGHALENPAKTLSTMTALILGSPEFQRR